MAEIDFYAILLSVVIHIILALSFSMLDFFGWVFCMQLITLNVIHTQWFSSVQSENS